MKLFRALSEGEVTEFKAAARRDYKPYSDIKGIWHPVYQSECVAITSEADLPKFFDEAIASIL